MRTLALLVLMLLALALAACDSAPPTAGSVESGRSPHADAGSHCHAHLHTYAVPDRNPNADRDANGRRRTVAHAQGYSRTRAGADLA